MNAMVPIQPSNAEVYRASTDAAGLCRDIVLKTAQNIQGRKYVKVEGWQAIAIAHGCVASADHVERVTDEGCSGFRAIGTVRRMSDGAEIARAEGFIGDDETMWAKRPVYARRAMVQTRAISRACRSAFAHVVVLIDANLSTTPAEEVDFGQDDPAPVETVRSEPAKPPLAVTVAMTAITMAETRDELKKWRSDNAAVLQGLATEHADEVVRHFNARWAALTPEKPPTVNVTPARNGHARATAPAGAFGIDSNDEIPF